MLLIFLILIIHIFSGSNIHQQVKVTVVTVLYLQVKYSENFGVKWILCLYTYVCP